MYPIWLIYQEIEMNQIDLVILRLQNVLKLIINSEIENEFEESSSSI